MEIHSMVKFSTSDEDWIKPVEEEIKKLESVSKKNSEDPEYVTALTTTELGRKLKSKPSPQKLNKILAKKGVIKKHGISDYILCKEFTDLGFQDKNIGLKSEGGVNIMHTSSSVRWRDNEKVISTIEKIVEEAEKNDTQDKKKE